MTNREDKWRDFTTLVTPGIHPNSHRVEFIPAFAMAQGRSSNGPSKKVPQNAHVIVTAGQNEFGMILLPESYRPAEVPHPRFSQEDFEEKAVEVVMEKLR